MWAKPKRTGRKVLKHQEDPLGARGVRGGWLGVHEETGENLVALLKPNAPVIRVRTIARRPIDERWVAESVIGVSRTPKTSPKDAREHRSADAWPSPDYESGRGS